jgi:hypothetical protein
MFRDKFNCELITLNFNNSRSTMTSNYIIKESERDKIMYSLQNERSITLLDIEGLYDNSLLLEVTNDIQPLEVLIQNIDNDRLVLHKNNIISAYGDCIIVLTDNDYKKLYKQL